MSGSAQTVYLHIGAAKSGTTYLQHVLMRNRRALGNDGLLVPHTSMFRAALDLRQLKFAAVDDPAAHGAWRRLVTEIENWSGPAVVSHELLAGTRPKLVTRAMDDLFFADVHIVLTMRPMEQTLPAAWQERVKLGGTETLEQFVAGVRNAPPAGGDSWTEAAHKFWNLQNIPSVLAKWGRGIAPQNVHIVPVPAAADSATSLWQLFAGAIGVDPARYEASGDRANASMGAVETTVLRQFNEQVGRDYPWEIYAPLVKNYLADELGARPGPGIALPEDDRRWAEQWTAETVRFIERSRFHVVGDLADLTRPVERPGLAPTEAPIEKQLAAAISGMAALAQFVAADPDTHNAQTRRVLAAQLRRSRSEAQQALAAPTKEVARRLLDDLSTRMPTLGRAVRNLRESVRERRHQNS